MIYYHIGSGWLINLDWGYIIAVYFNIVSGYNYYDLL